MTKKRMRMDNTGKCAVYNVSDADAGDPTAGNGPFTTPLSNLSDVKFHSDFDYVPFSSVVTGTLSLPLRGTSPPGVYATHTLFAHGAGAVPLVMAVFPNLAGSGINVASFGSVPVQPDGTAGSALQGYWRWLLIQADATNVYAQEVSMAQTSGFSAMNVDYKVFISPLTIASPLLPAAGGAGEQVYMDGNDIRFGVGRINSRRRYLCKDTGGSSFHFAGGKTCDVRHIIQADGLMNNQHCIDWRYSVGGYVAMKDQDLLTVPASYANSTFDASTVQVDVL